MGYNQEAYDTECAALARELGVAGRAQMVPERVSIFTDAQATTKHRASEEPGPGQTFAIQPRKVLGPIQRWPFCHTTEYPAAPLSRCQTTAVIHGRRKVSACVRTTGRAWHLQRTDLLLATPKSLSLYL